MKKNKYPTSLIILALLGALFLYVKFFEKGAKKEEGQVQVFSLDRNAVTRIELKKENQETVLIKDGASWMLSPENVLARKDMVDGMLDELSDFTAERRLSDNVSLKDLKVFGLDKPKYSFSVFTGNTEAASVSAGDSAPVGGVLYVKEEKKPFLYTVISYRMDKFNKSGKDLREMKIVFVDSDKLNEISIKGKDAEYDFSKYGDEWHLTKPQSKIMKAAMPDLESHLVSLQARSFVSGHPKDADLKKYALDMPLYIVTLKGGGKEQTLRLSKKGNTYYALSSVNPSVAAVGDEMFTSVRSVLKEAREPEKKETGKPLTPALKSK